jgi:hypothetical protein
MKRRTFLSTGCALVVVKANANPLAFFVTPLAEAILQTFKSTIGFFIKEYLPAWMKSSTLRSLLVTVATALGITEALNRINHEMSAKSQTVSIGQAVATAVVLANKDVHDAISNYTAIALYDKVSEKNEVFQSLEGVFRLAANSGLELRITTNGMPTVGYKEVHLISDGKVIGRSPSIRVTVS